MPIRCGRLPLAGALLALALAAGAARAGDGAALYRAQCASCHGADGAGPGAETPLFVTRPPALRGRPADDIVRRLADGRTRMLALDEPALRARATQVEPLVAWLQRLPTVDWPRADRGGELYAARCADCHGAFGAPPAAAPVGVRAPRDLGDSAFQVAHGEASLIEAVRHGRAGMPALTPRLSEAEATDVATYVRLLSPGYTTYAQYCAACHGDHGVPLDGLAESARPVVVFDRAWLARQDPEALRRSVWHMLGERQPAMPHLGAQLTPAQTQAIARYLAGAP